MTSAGSGSWIVEASADLARLARGEAEGRRLAEELLRLLALASGGPAALYLRSERGFRRELATRDATFAEQLPGPPPDSAGVLAFGGGFLRWTPVSSEGRSDLAALLVAVTAAARELSLLEQLKRRDFEAKTRGVQLEALYDVGLAIAGTLDFEKLCEEILMRSVSLLDARRGALYLRRGARMELDRAFGGPAEPLLDPQSTEVRALLDGLARPNCCALPGAQHLLGVPVESDGIAKGILVVGDKESRRGVGPFPETDRRTLELLANQAAIALENAELHRQSLEKERLEREIELASEIQRQILPKGLPSVAGWELVGWNRPARHIGGDYYDLFRLQDETTRLAVVVGDVSGKGVPAALLVSTLHSALRLLVERMSVCPDLLSRLNQHILESSAPNKFITLFLGELDPANGELTYLNAGHNPGLVVRAGGGVEQLGPGGLPLGLMPGASFRAERLVLAPGDLLCLYSDGITEATAPSDEEFGAERLAFLLGENRERSVVDILAEIDRSTTAFAAGSPQGDDQTVLLIRRRPAGADA